MNLINRFLRLTAAVLLLAGMTLSARAFDPGERPLIPVGVSDGQTIRVVAWNTSTNRQVKISVKFIDAEGNLVLSLDPATIAAGKIATFDLARAAINNESGREQIRPVAILGDRASAGLIHVTIEVFNNDDGKTTVLWDGPPAL